MPLDLATFARTLQVRGEFQRLALDPMAQFGTENEPLLGATLLPEMGKDANSQNGYTEMQIRYQTGLANAGSSYSPAQLNSGGRIIGSFDVKPGNTNQADQLTAQDYEDLRSLLMHAEPSISTPASLEAVARLMGWMDTNINQPMLKLNELYRWQAIIDAKVERRGSNGYAEDVVYPTPAGHRVTVPSGTIASPTGWYSTGTNYDPYQDFFAAQRFLSTKGYRVNRIISCFEPAYTFMKNPANGVRFGGISLDSGNQFARILPQLTMERVNQELNANGLPTWEVWDQTYFYKDATGNFAFRRYLERDTYFPVILVCNTGRNTTIDFGDRSTMTNTIQLSNTLGYYCVGRVLGQNAIGRKIYTNVEEKHPGGMYAESVQEGLPVITEPEAIFILKIMKPTP